jgi:hypothetical protein
MTEEDNIKCTGTATVKDLSDAGVTRIVMADTQKATPTWFLLFGGFSADGRGPGTYVGRTTDKAKALAHYKELKRDVYSVGFVQIVTDEKTERASEYTDWDKL